MARDEVTLYNLALTAVGTKGKLSATTEASREAEVCTLWYEITRDTVFRAAYWPSTRAFRRLALLAERDFSDEWDTDDPSPNWRFAYGVPSDLIAPRFMSTYARFTWELYRPTSGNTVMAFMTNQEDAIMEYSIRQENPALWDDSLFMAMAYALASNIAMPLHGKIGRARDARERANQLILSARENAANAVEDEYDTIPPWIDARGYNESMPRNRFFWPYGPLLGSNTENKPSTTRSFPDAL